MCGLGAILRTDGGPIDESWLDIFSRRVGYRGPDGAGRFRDVSPNGARVALVHHRLSILDHDCGGQPMTSGTGDDLVAVVFNGCIYNHRALRRELAALGHRFTSDHSDTEVLLHGHRAWGPALPDHLEGMYAYVIWDRTSGEFVRARDAFGEKPLYRAERNGILIVASDARAVAEVANQIAPGALIDDDPSWLTGYLQLGYGPSGTTGYRGVSAMAPVGPPAPQPMPSDASPNERDPMDAVETALDAAVAARLEADVPLGGFLSGGVDSSLIAHYARRHLDDFRTFSVRMPDERYDESRHAERVAAHLGTNHLTLDVRPDPAADLVALIGRLGQPFGDSSLLPTSWVTRAARAHVTVALAGDGADELFLGYERYLAARPLARGHRMLRHLPEGLGRRRHPKSRLHKAGRLGAMARDFDSAGVLAMETIFDRAQRGELIDVPLPPGPRVDPGADALTALRDADLRGYLPGDLLTKVDTASMAFALEVRCPYLDRRLAATALGLPSSDLLRHGQRKGLLRALARRHLPADVVDRPKMGFAIPIGAWFRQNHGGLQTMLLDHLNDIDPFGALPVSITAARRLVDEHIEGRAEHGQRVFTLLTLLIWVQQTRTTGSESLSP